MNARRAQPGIIVTGSGMAAAPVDQVLINLAVDIIRPDAGDAFRLVGETVTRLLGVLADDGVDARRVRTQDLSLGARTEWQENHEVLIGYQANQRLTVRLDDLSGVERLLSDVATRSGQGIRIEGVWLTAAHPQEASTAAREDAFADAKVKATHYAGLAGHALGAVDWVQEGSADQGRRAIGLGFQAMAAGPAMPIAAGDAMISATVTVRWAFADVHAEVTAAPAQP